MVIQFYFKGPVYFESVSVALLLVDTLHESVLFHEVGVEDAEVGDGTLGAGLDQYLIDLFHGVDERGVIGLFLQAL